MLHISREILLETIFPLQIVEDSLCRGGSLSGLNLCGCSACCQGLCDLMCASALFCLEDMVSLVQPPTLALQMFLSPLPQASRSPEGISYSLCGSVLSLYWWFPSTARRSFSENGRVRHRPRSFVAGPWVASAFHLLCPVLP